MRIIDNILRIIKEKKTTKYRVTKDCNLPSNIFTFWENGRQKPSLDALIKIADYFNVSLDYLVGREPLVTNQEINPSNNATISPVFDRFSKLTELQQAKVMAYIDGMQEVKPSNSINTKQLIADAVNGKTTEEKSNKNKKMA